MKADPFVQLRLLDLQALDSSVDRLAHQRRTLPELAEITRLEALVAARRDDVVVAETTVGDLQRELDKADGDIEQVRARKSRDEQRLASGAITVPKQLSEIEHEVATLARRQSDLEDAQLEVMERMEQAQAELDRLLTEREGYREAITAAQADRDAAWTRIDEQAAQSGRDRTAVAAEMPADLLALYEKIRAAEGGIGAAPIAQVRCGGCRLELLNNEKAAFRNAPVDEVLRHEECRRIVVRTAESGL